jgi:peptidylprolyl isomerase
MKRIRSAVLALALLGAGGTASAATPAPGAPPAAKVGMKVTTSSGLSYVDEVIGHGAMPVKGQDVTVHYVGMLTDGKIFDASRDHGGPFSFVIGEGNVIPGWDEGVATMRVGGKRKLTIPPQLGYGAAGAGGVIPPNATLIFEIELLAVK